MIKKNKCSAFRVLEDLYLSEGCNREISQMLTIPTFKLNFLLNEVMKYFSIKRRGKVFFIQPNYKPDISVLQKIVSVK